MSGAAAAGGIALINTLGQLGGIVSPVMVGRIKDLSGSTTPALYVIGALALLCAALLAFALPESLRRREPRPSAAPRSPASGALHASGIAFAEKAPKP